MRSGLDILLRLAASPLTALLLLFGAITAAWWPIFSHYRLTPPDVPVNSVAQHRAAPSDALLAEIADQSLSSDHPIGGANAVPLARGVLQGRLELPNFRPLQIAPAFAAADLELGDERQQLAIASLIVPDLLLRAYETTRDAAFFTAARTYLLNFIAFEADEHLPSGFLWNGHAIVARAGVLARFWRHERARTPGDDAAGRGVLLHATRIAEMLSKPSHFTVATNHGVMHNIGLMQIASAFPALPRAADYRRLAIDRLRDQMAFYVSDEGVVLEHSAGYQFAGAVLLGYAVRLVELAGEPVPPEWIDKRDKALAFLARLQRPDRTLPLFGATMNYRWRLPASIQTVAPKQESAATTLYPTSGYAIASDRYTASPAIDVHTVVPWAHFPGHGHMHAQEMSLLLWAAGTDWITNSGYWPYDDPAGLIRATGWAGGNAPHLVDEPVVSARDTRLRGFLEAPDLRLFDLERSVSGGPQVRRQILQVEATRWLVLDTYSDPARRPLRVLWTTYPGVELRNAGSAFELRRPGNPIWMSIALRGTAIDAQPRFGSREPFAGWVSVDRKPAASHAIDARLAAPDGWMLSALSLHTDTATPLNPVETVAFRTPDDWEITLHGTRGPLTLKRSGMSLSAGDSAGQRTFALAAGTDVTAQRASITTALEQANAKYPRYRDIEPYRMKATAVLAGTWMALQLALAPIGWRSRTPVPALRSLANLLWAVGAGWIVFGYLAT